VLIHWVLGTVVSLIVVVPVTLVAAAIFIWELEQSWLLFRHAMSSILSIVSAYAGYGLFVWVTPVHLKDVPGWVPLSIFFIAWLAPFALFAVQTLRRLAPQKVPSVEPLRRRIRLNPFMSRSAV